MWHNMLSHKHTMHACSCILLLPLQTTGLNEIIPESLLSIFDENELEVCLCTCIDDMVFN